MMSELSDLLKRLNENKIKWHLHNALIKFCITNKIAFTRATVVWCLSIKGKIESVPCLLSSKEDHWVNEVGCSLQDFGAISYSPYIRLMKALIQPNKIIFTYFLYYILAIIT